MRDIRCEHARSTAWWSCNWSEQTKKRVWESACAWWRFRLKRPFWVDYYVTALTLSNRTVKRVCTCVCVHACRTIYLHFDSVRAIAANVDRVCRLWCFRARCGAIAEVECFEARSRSTVFQVTVCACVIWVMMRKRCWMSVLVMCGQFNDPRWFRIWRTFHLFVFIMRHDNKIAEFH